MDAAHRVALAALITLGRETEFQFLKAKKGERPLVEVLIRARRLAIVAMAELASVDPSDAEGVRKLQNEVNRFIDMLEYTKGILTDASEAADEIGPDDEAEMDGLIFGNDGERT